MKKSYTQENLLELLEQHKDNITSTSNWKNYRYGKEDELPHSQTIISHFGSWNTLKELLGLKTNKQSRPQKYAESELLAILEQHKSHYTSVAAWDAFAEENELPKHFLFLERLGSDVLAEKVGYIHKWNSENLESCILEYFPKKPPTQMEWSSIYKEYESLPTYMTIVRHYGSWNKMKSSLYFNRNDS